MQELYEVKNYKLSEIFYSIQGEGAYAGTAMLFVRFAGCNLDCSFCDTDYSVKMELTKQELVERIRKHCNDEFATPVCFTGGEPSLQVGEGFLTDLRRKVINVPLHIETNGVRKLDQPQQYECVTVSPKLPVAECRQQSGTELKIVFDTSHPSLLHAIMKGWEYRPFQHKFLQPVTYSDGRTNVAKVVEYIKENPEWRLSLQTQKMINIQ